MFQEDIDKKCNNNNGNEILKIRNILKKTLNIPSKLKRIDPNTDVCHMHEAYFALQHNTTLLVQRCEDIRFHLHLPELGRKFNAAVISSILYVKNC